MGVAAEVREAEWIDWSNLHCLFQLSAKSLLIVKCLMPLRPNCHAMDIGQAIIEAGLALDCPRYSGGKYAEFEMKGAANTLPGYCR